MLIPKVSILTSCFNADNYLSDSIESILNQTLKDFEYILVDDGSTDNTLEIIKKYASQDERIIFSSKENTGLADSLNYGLRLAKGEWIARIDADDIALSKRLEYQIDFVKHSGKHVLVGSGCIETDEQGNFIKSHRYPSRHTSLVQRLEQLGPFFPHSSALIKRRVIQGIGGYRPRYTSSEDWDLWLRLAEVGLLGCVKEPLVRIRKRSASLSNADGGRLLHIMGVAATVCYLRRKAGLFDPSQATEGEWLGFVGWLEKRLEDEGYFEESFAWQSLRSQFYADRQISFYTRLARLISHLVRYPPKLNIMRARLLGAEIPRKLAKESEILCHHHLSRLVP
jgi:glycosyltransferase involved in cell wall biosynthesis